MSQKDQQKKTLYNTLLIWLEEIQPKKNKHNHLTNF